MNLRAGHFLFTTVFTVNSVLPSLNEVVVIIIIFILLLLSLLLLNIIIIINYSDHCFGTCSVQTGGGAVSAVLLHQGTWQYRQTLGTSILQAHWTTDKEKAGQVNP